MAPPPKLPKELDLPTAFELTRKLVANELPAGSGATAPERTSLAKDLGYWLWRMGGRKRPPMVTDARHFSKLAEKYERDLTRQRERVAELERLTGQLQKAFDAELNRIRAEHAREREAWDAKRTEAAALAEAEARARLAENKVEVLKDALELARARSGSGESMGADSRFRDAKRAFARAFHPDQGGRDDPERQRMFLEFWPELERIERED